MQRHVYRKDKRGKADCTQFDNVHPRGTRKASGCTQFGPVHPLQPAQVRRLHLIRPCASVLARTRSPAARRLHSNGLRAFPVRPSAIALRRFTCTSTALVRPSPSSTNAPGRYLCTNAASAPEHECTTPRSVQLHPIKSQLHRMARLATTRCSRLCTENGTNRIRYAHLKLRPIHLNLVQSIRAQPK